MGDGTHIVCFKNEFQIYGDNLLDWSGSTAYLAAYGLEKSEDG